MSTPKKTPARAKAGHPAGSAEQRRKLFVEALLSNGENVTEAALAAGFSPKSAASQGSRLLKNVKTRQLIDSRRATLLEKARLTTEAVMENLAQALFFDPRKLLNEDGAPKALHELDADTAQALAGFEVTDDYSGTGDKRQITGRKVKIRWLDKNAAREQAAKMLGMFERDNRQKIDPLSELLREVMGKRTSLPIVPEDPAHKGTKA